MDSKRSDIKFTLNAAALGRTCFWEVAVIESSNKESIPLGDYLVRVPRKLADSAVSGKDVYSSDDAILFDTVIDSNHIHLGLNKEKHIHELLESVGLLVHQVMEDCYSDDGYYQTAKDIDSNFYDNLIERRKCEDIEDEDTDEGMVEISLSYIDLEEVKRIV